MNNFLVCMFKDYDDVLECVPKRIDDDYVSKIETTGQGDFYVLVIGRHHMLGHANPNKMMDLLSHEIRTRADVIAVVTPAYEHDYAISVETGNPMIMSSIVERVVDSLPAIYTGLL